MAFNLMPSAQARRRAVDEPQLNALVRASAEFNGRLVERPHKSREEAHAA